MNDTTSTDERTAYTDGLRALADWLDTNPHIDLPWTGSEYDTFQLAVWTTKEQLATIARALPGKVRKEFHTTTVDIHASFGGLHVRAYAGRSEVCERIVTGTETVTVPAVEAKPETTETREVVEWRCTPLLAETDDAAEVSA